MKLRAASTRDSKAAGVEALGAQLEDGLAGDALSLLFVHGRAAALTEDFRAGLVARFPGVPVLGGSSCQGAMSSAAAGPEDVVVLALSDAGGSYGVGAAELGADPVAAGRQAVQVALTAADRESEVPELVWIVQPPGHEEAVLQGVAEVVGEDVPVLGGSTADDDVSGQWCAFDQQSMRPGQVLVAVLFPSGTLGYAFQSGYDATEAVGTVTARDGRKLISIDGEPAAAWYHRHTQSQLLESPFVEANVLGATTLAPLGREVGEVHGVPTFLLVHPERVHADGALSTFALVAERERVRVMTGTLDSLSTRSARVALEAMTMADLEPADVQGALVVYCGGCRLTVGDRMSEVVDGLRIVLGQAPFIGTFTFGEAGYLVDRSYHGNLMISVIVFAQD